MPCGIQRLTPGARREHMSTDADLVACEQPFARGHFKYQGIEPVHQQQLFIGRLACHLDHAGTGYLRRIGNHGGQGNGRLSERLFPAAANATHTDIRAVRKMLPVRVTHGQSPTATGPHVQPLPHTAVS